MSETQTDIIEALGRFRLERDLTHREVAARLGVSTSTVLRLVSGRYSGLERTRFKVRRLLEAEGYLPQDTAKPTAAA